MAELYKLPDGWEWKTIDEFATIKSGKRVPKSKKLLDDVTPYPYIRVTDFSDNGTVDTSDIKYISEDIYQQIKNYTITDEDIYISVAGTIGKTGIIPSELNGANLTENAVKIVFDNSKYDKNFIFNFTNSITFMEQIGLATKTVAMPKLAIKRLKEVFIPLPSLEEQKRIVSKLDTLFEKIDKSISLHQKNIDEANVFMASVLNDVFVELEERYEKEELNEIVIFGGKNISTLEYPNLIYFSLEDIEAQTGRILNFKTVNKAGVRGTAVKFDENVVLYSKLRPYLNKVIVPNLVGCSTTELVVLKPKDKLDKYFLASYLRSSNIVNFLNNDSMGAKMPRTNMKTFRNLELPLPPLQTQQKVVTYLDEISQKMDKIKQIQKEKMQSLKALKASILDKAFRGEL